MPTPKIPNNSQQQAAIEDATHYAAGVAERLMGPPPQKLSAASTGICEIVAHYNQDDASLKAAALLPYLNAQNHHWQSARNALPSSLAPLIDNLLDIAAIDQLQQTEHQQERLRRMLLAMVNDLRCVVIKLAQHLYELRQGKELPRDAQIALAQRSFSLYAPLANRLGIWQLKWEIEDLAFRYNQPEQYKLLAKKLRDKRADREHYIDNVVAQLESALAQQNLEAEVLGRPKHIYSIHKKMQQKSLRFEQLFDILALRVLVKSEPDCYRALGIVHSLWAPVRGEFDDYLAKPKANGYRSIHTAVFGAEGKPLEVQIRTQEMHEQAELGVAAHWRYKEGSDNDENFNRKIAWLREILQASQETDDDLIPSLAQQVFDDYIYVLTPQGDVVDLPAGATPIDFAFQVHTEVGYRCRGARINGNIVPLNTRLNNGDQVEVITANVAQPSRDWLNAQLGYIHTTKARSRLRSWFRALHYDDNLAAGRDILERELKRLGQSDTPYEQLCRQFNKSSPDDFLAAIGAGDISAAQLAGQLTPNRQDGLRILSRDDSQQTAEADISVAGIGELMSSLARCCKPVFGDDIGGFVTRGRGVSIHRQDCEKFVELLQQHPERAIEVCWGQSKTQQLPVSIKIEAWDRHGLLRDISAILSNQHINVLGIHSDTDTKAHKAYIRVNIEIDNITNLSALCNRISQIPNVIEAERG